MRSSLPAVPLTLIASACIIPATEPAPRLAFEESRDFTAWQTELRDELADVMQLPGKAEWPLKVSIRPDSKTDAYTMDRIEFTAEPGERVPGYLLLPKKGESPYPVMICLQGHAPGMHISIGRAKNAKERNLIKGGRDLALQAVRHGWAAVVVEQRGFGERAEKGISCQNRALQDLLKGRPLTGQRVFDISRTIDFIETRQELDAKRIACIGNSTGGTVSYYAACVEPRIRLAVVSCSFGTFESTWLYKQHCACGYLPGLLKVADMPDLAGLVAPRHLILVAGKTDYIARFDGVQRGYETAKRCFQKAGHPDRLSFVVGEGGHQFYPEQTWPLIQKTLKTWDRTSRTE